MPVTSHAPLARGAPGRPGEALGHTHPELTESPSQAEVVQERGWWSVGVGASEARGEICVFLSKKLEDR